MSDLVGNRNCWFSHAVAHLSVFSSVYFLTIFNCSFRKCLGTRVFFLVNVDLNAKH